MDADKRSFLPFRQGVCAVHVCMFVAILTVAWFIMPVEPYATFEVDEESYPFLFSPDSTLLVTLGTGRMARHGPLRIWEVERGIERFSVARKWKAIETVLFSPDSRLLAAHETEGDLVLWNTSTGEEVARLALETKFANLVNYRFSPDGRFLIFQDYRKWPDLWITFWNISSQQEQGSFESYFHSLEFAREGRTFATFRWPESDTFRDILLWRMEQTPMLLRQHRIRANQVAIAPDLRIFAAVRELDDENRQVVLCDMITGEEAWSEAFRGIGSEMLSFIARGKILAARGVERTLLWDVTSVPKQIGSFSEMPAVSLDGKWLAFPHDSGAKLSRALDSNPGIDLVCEGDYGSDPAVFSQYNNHKHAPNQVFSPDSQLLLVEGLYRNRESPFLHNWLPQKYNPFRARPVRSITRFWNVETGQHQLEIESRITPRFTSDGKVMATLRDKGAIDLWHIPFRVPFSRILGWALIIWFFVTVVFLCATMSLKRLLSRRTM